MSLKIGLITNCSVSKNTPAILSTHNMPANMTFRDALAWWIAADRAVPKDQRMTPMQQYKGMAFNTLQAISKYIPNEHMYVVTGGQGMMNLVNDTLVPYEFSGDPKEPDAIQGVITQEPFAHSVWWEGINEGLRGTPSPVHDMMLAKQYDYLFVACTKVFLKYIARDILAIHSDTRARVFILTSQSNVGNIPSALKPNLVPYSRDFMQHIPGNRNNGIQRALLTILEKTKPGTLNESEPMREIELDQLLKNMKEQSFIPGQNEETTDLELVFKEHPEYLTLGVEDAYARARKAYGTLGGRTNFRAYFSRITGDGIADNAKTASDAAFEGFEFTSGGSASSNEAITDTLMVFVDGFKRHAPRGAIFNADMVIAWAQKYFPGLGKGVPEEYTSTQKIGSIISAACDGLGLTRVKAGSKVSYFVTPEEDDSLDDADDEDDSE